VPDDLTIQLWEHHMDVLVGSNRFLPDSDTLILDGIPRSRHQAEMLEGRVDVRLLLHLQAGDEDQMVQRIRKRALQENRLDDASEDVIRRRFREYEAETKPVLEFYSPSRIRTIDAGAAPLEVLRQVVEVLQVMLFPETLQHAA
jgi:adenylate kinase